MAEEERNEDVTPEEEQAPQEEAPQDAASAEEAPAAEESPATDEAPAAEEAPAPEESPATDEAPAAEEAPAETEESPAAAEPEAPAAEAPKAKDLPPGAELDPIQLEPDRPMDAEERARLEAEEEERALAEAAAEESDEPLARSGPRIELETGQIVQATGKRKTSIARVVVRSGSGTFEVNRRPLEGYFPRAHLQTIARQALVTAGYEDSVDVAVRVHGGGLAGQAGAVRHGIAKALTEIDGDLRGELKRRGFLTRDARIKERRKAGLKKARKRPQFSKR